VVEQTLKKAMQKEDVLRIKPADRQAELRRVVGLVRKHGGDPNEGNLSRCSLMTDESV
jgi:hypothetical protein